MSTQPKIQIDESYTTVMEAPEIEVTAWWSLSNVDTYRFVETDPARSGLEFADGIRSYDTEFGEVTVRLDDPEVPQTVRRSLRDEGYRLVDSASATDP